MYIIKLLLLIIMLSLIASLSTLNAQMVEVNYFFGTQTMPLALCFGIGLFLGVLLGMLLCAKQMVLLWTRLYTVGKKLKNTVH